MVIGDGVEDDTRDVIAAIDDPRLQFIDSAKSSSRAELVRHHVLMGARSDYVCYLGDDDLMLKDHVETMIEVLQSVDFAHPLPVYILPDGGFGAHLTDLSRSECREWHLHPARNAVSLTGAAHRLDTYRALPFGWRESPAGRWSDHYMWQQWFQAPGIRYRTNSRLTVLKFDSSLRGESSSEDRRTEMLRWLRRSDEEGFTDWLQSEATAAILTLASRFVVHADHVADVREKESADRLAIELELEGVRAQVRDLEAALRVRETNSSSSTILFGGPGKLTPTWQRSNSRCGRSPRKIYSERSMLRLRVPQSRQLEPGSCMIGSLVPYRCVGLGCHHHRRRD